MTYNKLFPRLLLALLVIISVSARTDAQYCELDYIYPSSFNFPSAGGSEEIEIGIMGMCTVTYSNVPAWINVYCSGGAGSIVCSSNTGAARNARIYVRLNGQARGFFDVSQAEGYPPLIAGTISTNKTFVCYGTSPGTFSSTSAASGGNCSGAYSYQWQYSTNGSTYYNISGETSLTYTPGNLTSTRYYRRRVTCSGATEYSNRLTITVNPPISGGSITGNQTICYNDYPTTTLSATSSGSGGYGTLRYSWESSTNGGVTWETAYSDDPFEETYYYPSYAHTSTTRYRRLVTDSRNCTASSNSVAVTVRDQLLPGSISGSETLCYGEDAGLISSTQAASGGSGFYYTWQKSTDGGTTWTSAGSSSATFNPGVLYATTKYRRRATDSGCSDVVYSDPITKTVRNQLSGGTIGSTQTICYNANLGSFSNIASASGGTGSFSYQWQQSTNGGSTWNDISGATSSTYDPPALATTHRYRRKATDNGGCGTVYSNIIIITVRQVLAGGSIGSNHTICYNDDPDNLTSISGASGGSSSYSYQWQYSSDEGSSWNNSSGATSATYDPSTALTSDRQYRRRVTDNNGCGTTYSTNTVTVTVRSELSGGSISNSRLTLCYNEDATAFTNSAYPSGGTGSYSYQWQKSTDGGSTWNDISGATSSTYNPSNLTITHKYRRKVTDNGGCGIAYTNDVTLTVLDQLVAGIISNSQPTICYNEDAAAFTNTASASGGTESYSYQWEQSTDGGSTWNNISGATSSTYNPPNLTTTHKYRRKVSDNGGCGTAYTDPFTITVRAQLTGGAISGDQSICRNTDAGAFSSVSLPGGGTGSYTYQWRYSSDGGSNWYNVGDGGTSSTYNPTAALNQNTLYRRRVTDNGGCGTAYSNYVTVTIKPEPTAPTGIYATEDSICPGSETTLTVIGGSLTEGYNWEWYTGSISGDSVHTGPSYLVSPGSATTYYVRAEGICNPSGAVSKTITVKQPPSIQTQPYNQKVIPGNQANFTVSASGTITSYQWQESFTAYGPWDNIPSSDSPALNYITDESDRDLIFVRCLVNGDCSYQTISDAASVSFELPPYIVDESGGIHINSKGELEAHVFASHEFDWTDGSLFDFGGPGSVEWDDGMHAWKCTGYVTMYLNTNNAIPIDVNRSYRVSVEVFSEVNEPTILYWGGIRLDENKNSLQGYGGNQDYSATRGSEEPLASEWTTYTSNPKTDTVCSYNGWCNDNCSYYRIGGLINYNGENTQVTYVRDIRFYESSDEYSYQWKKNDISIPGETKPVLNITRSEIDLTIGDTLSCEVDGMASYFLSPSYASHNFNKYLNPDTDENYIHTVIPQIEITDEDIFDRNTDCIINQVSYFDGLGRPLQNISVSASPSVMDIIQLVVYDDYGREAILYLSYESYTDNLGAYQSTAIGSTYGAGSKQYDFYNDAENDVTDDPNPFAETVFEASPLSRVLEQGSPGASWQPENVSIPGSGHTVKYDWGANQENDVLKFYISGDDLALDLPEDKYYDEGELYKTVTKNENWTSGNINTTEEYRDKQGQVILKRTYVGPTPEKVETYYVYDIYGLLRYVITPAAAYEIVKTGSTVTFPLDKDDNIIKNLCYYYRYDARKRMTEKQLPGSEPVYMVYDKRDRLVLTQDGNLREDINHNDLKKWMFTKYDHLNRPVITGILTADHVYSQPVMQDTVDNAYDGTSLLYYVEKDIGEIITLGYTDTSFPHSGNTFIYNSEIEYLTATYYDDYNFPDTISFDTDNGISGYSDDEGNVNYFDNALGLVTGTKVKILNTGNYITTTNYYDNRYRLLQSISTSDWDDGAQPDFTLTETVSTDYDFTGKVLALRQEQVITDGEQTISSEAVNKYYTYDHTGRLTRTEQQVEGDNNGRVTIAELEYNAIGELKTKSLHAEEISRGQVLDYKYNIRGWLTSVNDPDDLGMDNMFGMTLLYNDISSLSALTGSQEQYNGILQV